jgi:hypothetical protein
MTSDFGLGLVKKLKLKIRSKEEIVFYQIDLIITLSDWKGTCSTDLVKEYNNMQVLNFLKFNEE